MNISHYRFFFFLTKTLYLGPKFRQRFLCEVRVPGFQYVGAGNSTNKKDAEKNASRDFVNFLVRSGKVNERDVPADESNPQQPQSNDSSQAGSFGASHSGNLSNFQPTQLGQAYRPYNQYNEQDNYAPQSYMERAQQQARMEEAESLDVNAG